MPTKTWATNDVPTASDLNTQYRDQVITTCTSGTRPSGTEGQMIYETDTDLLYIYNGGWVRFGASGGWASYTPVLTQSGAITKTVNYAKYEKIGRQVTAVAYLTLTGTGTATNIITISLPFTAATTVGFGSGWLYDSSAGLVYPGIAIVNSVTTMAMYDSTAASGPGGYLGLGGFTAALASPDQVVMGVTYEAST